MVADFDVAATSYDKEFTHSNIGAKQRIQVWRFLDQALEKDEILKILELNCGTGEDAAQLAGKGHKVVATDVSTQMLNIAKRKNRHLTIEYLQVDLNDINSKNMDKDYDLVFSNFGGLNCVDHRAITRMGGAISQILKPGGSFISVVMPKLCIWEILYLTVKGKLSQAFRRNKGVALVNVGDLKVKTWYYSPRQFHTLLGPAFKEISLKPVGFFIPPSYLEEYFRRHNRLLAVLNYFEKHFANFAWQAKFSDHFYIQYQLK